ncbi:unnamed protein product [Rotaria socialis]|uniref:MIT domain-containing protein n=1 Tax=Rotaria socialis TaxID=392032 RepID=A0A818GWA0_9BILA|nr:unnamed protein product [Rotaria socialis]CAF3308995.1 unnamed protein product [Rotaria socialis]CAF3425700.1 unnamed protein product [Rotaria socialis]CAF3434525.1 unnamed protein product [Rotaria socialis]CAF3497105.1 unnamed protein product [Rotaria socialis]
MNNNEQDNSKDLKANISNGINSIKSSIVNSEDKLVLNKDSKENESQNHIEEQNDDEFIRITAAHEILIEAQTCDEQENYSLALHLYRICVDFLLEELMFANGTEQSRIYLREKCAAIMDRIDILKTKLDPISSSATNQSSADSLPIDQFESINLS